MITAAARFVPRRMVGAALAVAMLAGGCSSSGLGGDAARVVEGKDVMRQDGGAWLAVGSGQTVPDGVRVRTGLSPARLKFAQGSVWLGPSAAMDIDGDLLTVDRGEVVVHSTGRLRTAWDGVEVSGAGIYRLSLGASPRVGAYEGALTVRRPGEERRLPALRQLGLGSRRLAATPDPLYYELDDAWDRELLPQAIAFDEEVARLARGIDREYGLGSRDAAFYSSFAAVEAETVPVLAATARRREADGSFGPPSDALITLFVASALAGQANNDTGLEEAVRTVAAHRSRGARWGLLALELGIAVRSLADAVDLARERREEVAPDPRSGGGGRMRPTPTGSPRPSPRPTASPTPRPTPTDPGPSEPPPEDPQGIIERALEGILG